MRDLSTIQGLQRLPDTDLIKRARSFKECYRCEAYKVSVNRKIWSVVVTEEDDIRYGRVEHISFADWNIKAKKVPDWYTQCAMKDLFFLPEEECFCVFPKKSEYVNLVESCMHIWHKVEDGR